MSGTIQCVLVHAFRSTATDRTHVIFDIPLKGIRREYTPGYASLHRIEQLFEKSFYPPTVCLSLFTMSWDCIFYRETRIIRTLSIKEDESDV